MSVILDLPEIRCPKCDRMLMRGYPVGVEIKCRCKYIYYSTASLVLVKPPKLIAESSNKPVLCSVSFQKGMLSIKPRKENT